MDKISRIAKFEGYKFPMHGKLKYNSFWLKKYLSDIVCGFVGKPQDVDEATTTITYHFKWLLTYRKCISFPFYFVSSLKNSIRAHDKILSSHVLHEGLILLIIEYSKALHVERNPMAKKWHEFKKNVRVHYGIPLLMRRWTMIWWWGISNLQQIGPLTVQDKIPELYSH